MTNRPNIMDLTLEDLDAMPTLHKGQFDNLKFEGGDIRVWLSRMDIYDGMPANNMVTVEQLIDGRWEEIATYPATRERPNDKRTD